uniref:Uncharacterized protein n=1 Tax=Chromera velia CCMP2878 TaxID=1169474 RepID=A0A0G4FR43_9ALVE|eukprot:Cvel_18310.t1-p1 / transcript=Cvel_18310.t1 / gene=Cvel_18310 / organism=Chromera_velia_CCMP2878 / gene_product=hypothetical protein / transcript_product=hypothetical protein / location=Cvel_scaffold1510:34266-43074(-) / protein_length=712 / sequence_SO=supercontig / SO=protein_coding / is_pseudo=false
MGARRHFAAAFWGAATPRVTAAWKAARIRSGGQGDVGEAGLESSVCSRLCPNTDAYIGSRSTTRLHEDLYVSPVACPGLSTVDSSVCTASSLELTSRDVAQEADSGGRVQVYLDLGLVRAQACRPLHCRSYPPLGLSRKISSLLLPAGALGDLEWTFVLLNMDGLFAAQQEAVGRAYPSCRRVSSMGRLTSLPLCVQPLDAQREVDRHASPSQGLCGRPERSSKGSKVAESSLRPEGALRELVQAVRRIGLRIGVLCVALEAAGEGNSRRIGEVPPQKALHRDPGLKQPLAGAGGCKLDLRSDLEKAHFRRDDVQEGEPFEDTGVTAAPRGLTLKRGGSESGEEKKVKKPTNLEDFRTSVTASFRIRRETLEICDSDGFLIASVEDLDDGKTYIITGTHLDAATQGVCFRSRYDASWCLDFHSGIADGTSVCASRLDKVAVDQLIVDTEWALDEMPDFSTTAVTGSNPAAHSAVKAGANHLSESWKVWDVGPQTHLTLHHRVADASEPVTEADGELSSEAEAECVQPSSHALSDSQHVDRPLLMKLCHTQAELRPVSIPGGNTGLNQELNVIAASQQDDTPTAGPGGLRDREGERVKIKDQSSGGEAIVIPDPRSAWHGQMTVGPAQLLHSINDPQMSQQPFCSDERSEGEKENKETPTIVSLSESDVREELKIEETPTERDGFTMRAVMEEELQNSSRSDSKLDCPFDIIK